MREDGSDAPSWAHPKGEGQEQAGVPMFRRKQLVRHLRTGGIYRILFTPAICRIETTNAPAYAYRMISYSRDGRPVDIADAPLWVRPQAEMEDGRFEPASAAGQSLSEPIQDGARTKSPNPEGKKP